MCTFGLDICNPSWRSRKEWSDRVDVEICFRAYQTLLNAAFLARLDPVFMEKMQAENWRSGLWGTILGSVDVGTGCRDTGTGGRL